MKSFAQLQQELENLLTEVNQATTLNALHDILQNMPAEKTFSDNYIGGEDLQFLQKMLLEVKTVFFNKRNEFTADVSKQYTELQGQIDTAQPGELEAFALAVTKLHEGSNREYFMEFKPTMTKLLAKRAQHPELKGSNLDAIVYWQIRFNIEDTLEGFPAAELAEDYNKLAETLLGFKKDIESSSLTEPNRKALIKCYNDALVNVHRGLHHSPDNQPCEDKKWSALYRFSMKEFAEHYPGLEVDTPELSPIIALYDKLKAMSEELKKEEQPASFEPAINLEAYLRSHEKGLKRLLYTTDEYCDKAMDSIRDAFNSLDVRHPSWVALLEDSAKAVFHLYADEQTKTLVAAYLEALNKLKTFRGLAPLTPEWVDFKKDATRSRDYLAMAHYHQRVKLIQALKAKLEAIERDLRDETTLEHCVQRYLDLLPEIALSNNLDITGIEGQLILHLLTSLRKKDTLHPLLDKFYAVPAYWEPMYQEIDEKEADALDPLAQKLTALKQAIENAKLSPAERLAATQYYNQVIDHLSPKINGFEKLVITERQLEVQSLAPHIRLLPAALQPLLNKAGGAYMRAELSLENYQNKLSGEISELEEDANIIHLKLALYSLGVPPSFKKRVNDKVALINKASNLQEVNDVIYYHSLQSNYMLQECVSSFHSLKRKELNNSFKQQLTALDKLTSQEPVNWQAAITQYVKFVPNLAFSYSDEDIPDLYKSILEKFTNWLLTKPAEAAVDPSLGLYVDPFFWEHLDKKMATATKQELDRLIDIVLPLKEKVSQLSSSVKIRPTDAYNCCLESLRNALLANNTFQNDARVKCLWPCEEPGQPYNWYYGIDLAERRPAGMPALHAKLQAIADSTPANERTAAATALQYVLTNAGHSYARARSELHDYINSVSESIDEHSPALADTAEGQQLLNELKLEVYSVGLTDTLKQALKTILETTDKASSMKALSEIYYQIPAEVDGEKLSEWRMRIDELSRAKNRALRSDLETTLAALQQKMSLPNTDWVSLAKTYLDLYPELHLANVSTHEVEKLFGSGLVGKKSLLDTETLSRLQIVCFGVPGVAGNLEEKIKKAHTDEELNEVAYELLSSKKAMQEQIDDELVEEHKPACIKYMNGLMQLMADKISKRPKAAPEFEDLAIFDRFKVLLSLNPWIAALSEKKAELSKDGHDQAATKAQELLTVIENAMEAYTSGQIELDVYKKQVQGAITTAHDELDKHRGWKQFLVNLALAVFTLGIGYLIAAAYQGCLFPAVHVATESEQKLDELEAGVSALRC